MLIASYVAAVAAILIAAIYLLFSLRPFLTTSTLLLICLLLIYGPTFISFTLSHGAPGFLINRLRGIASGDLRPGPIFAIIQAKVPDLDPVVTAMNLSIALMYAGIIIGLVAVDRLFRARAQVMQAKVRTWNVQTLTDDGGSYPMLLITTLLLASLMLSFSIREGHIPTIWRFLQIPIGDNAARNAFRAHFGGSPSYVYRLLLDAVAPVFVILSLLTGGLRKSWSLIAAGALLFVATMIGKADTLSKAPAALFLFQLLVAGLLVVTNRVTWRTALAAIASIAVVFYLVFRLVMISAEVSQSLGTIYVRAFEAPSQALLENFAAVPFVHPHTWGAGIRPIAKLMGLDYVPSYSVVAYTWYGNYDVTSPALFIADAWADFSYGGVFLFSVAAGAVCRAIDVIFLARGKSVVAIAVLASALLGIFTMMVTALNTALLSGGLVLAPALLGLFTTVSRRLPAPSK